MSKRLLAIETSSPRLSLAVGEESGPIREYRGSLQWRHAENLINGMQRLLSRKRWPPESLDAVAVSIGPGSFTGIRIGLACARALGQFLHIPLVGIPSLEILAFGAARTPGLICPCMDALRGDVFTAMYERTGSGRWIRRWKECLLPWPDLLRRLSAMPASKPVLLLGDGLSAHRQDVAGRRRWILARGAATHPCARILLELAWLRLRQARGRRYDRVLPLYLREAAARERLKP